LALLKHPLCAQGEVAPSFRAQVRVLDRLLRGPRPDAGLDGVRQAIERRRAAASDDTQARLSELQYWFAEVSAVLRPLESALSAPSIALKDAIEAHLNVAARLGGDALWAGEARQGPARVRAGLRERATNLPPAQ